MWALDLLHYASMYCTKPAGMEEHRLYQYAFMLYTLSGSRVQLKCDGTRWLTVGEVKGKLANGVQSQYHSHYLGAWCIQHYYR